MLNRTLIVARPQGEMARESVQARRLGILRQPGVDELLRLVALAAGAPGEAQFLVDERRVMIVHQGKA